MGSFSDAWRLDLFDLNYAYSHEDLKVLDFRNEDFLPRKGVLVRIGVFFHHLLRECLVRGKDGRVSCPPDHTVFFACSRNEMNSLRPIAERVPEATTLKIRAYAGERMEGGRMLNLAGAHLAALPFFPLVFLHFLRSRGYRRRSFQHTFDYYWLGFGFYIQMRRWLRRNRPACVVMANDHINWCRALLRAAAAEGVPSVYVPHACVNEHFPPLAFDLALLEGRGALDAYTRAGPSSTRVLLAGMPKFDPWIEQVKRDHAVERILICTNIDPLDRVQELCRHLRAHRPGLKLTLRPHPGDRRFDLWEAFTAEAGMALSRQSEESAFEAIGNADLLIAGESSILLEAALVNVFPLYYDFTGERWDWYGFERNGMVTRHANPDEVVHTLDGMQGSRPDVRERARPYCATVNTSWDGRSAELAADALCAFAHGDDPGPAWKRLEEVPGMEAYEPGN